jgi:hypothetical protein
VSLRGVSALGNVQLRFTVRQVLFDDE